MNMEKIIENAEQNIRQAIKDYGAHTNQSAVLDSISSDFIHKFARESSYAKQGLRKLFSKSPVWNEKLDALVINGTRTHNPDYNRVYDLAKEILKPAIYDCNSSYERRNKFYQMLSFFANPVENRHSDDVEKNGIAAINAIAPKAYAPNKKLSRIFKAICVELGVADESAGSGFQKLYAQFADELSAKKIDFKLYVSINPAHFLTMSNPKNDGRGPCLTSCHSLNSTEYEYNNGCIGYARDEVTFIVFTVSDPTNPETLNNRKTTRQIYAYKPDNGLLLQSRMYNTSGDVNGASEETKLYRDLIQREISMLEDKPNLWKTYPYLDGQEHTIETGTGFGGYQDWTYLGFDAHVSIRADHAEDFKPLTVGTWGMCVCCGKDNAYGLYCDDCGSECKRRCDHCEEYVSENRTIVYDEHGQELRVCSDCLDEHYTYCDECREYHADSVVCRIGQLYVCHDCREDCYDTCDKCGEYYRDEELTSVRTANGDEIYVCEDCCKLVRGEAESA